MGTSINKNLQDQTVFKRKLKDYKNAIDKDIATYAKYVQQTTLQLYGADVRREVDTFLSILGRGGKRIRGGLVILGYEMSGGQDRKMIVQVARAIEMLHAYVLIIDDIQDQSALRRGGPTAHVMLADYHRQQHLAGSADHFGMSVALNAALGGAHAAQIILANINADEDLRLKVLSIVNRTMLITAHGQTSDIMNEVNTEATQDDIEHVLEWKTAQYSFLNPLHVGMVLAGGDCAATDAITPYAVHTGKAFQITDDILGIFGSEAASGKSPYTDIRQGKRTLLTVYALEHAESSDKNFLIQMLGNQQLSPAEFKRCQDIFVESGALAHARQAAKTHVESALEALNHEKTRWPQENREFLRGMANYLLTRTT